MRGAQAHPARHVLRYGKEDAMAWIAACKVGSIDMEDVVRFDHGSNTFAIFRSPDDAYYATDGLCTHEKIHLAGGLVIDNTIECPKHNGRFDYTNGDALGAPVCVNLRVYPIKVEDGMVLIDV
jgi:3-phenylpropionate/trans-cinnamate dioxygenase ferredoxin subunit